MRNDFPRSHRRPPPAHTTDSESKWLEPRLASPRRYRGLMGLTPCGFEPSYATGLLAVVPLRMALSCSFFTRGFLLTQ